MGAMLLIGCILVAYSVPASVFFLLICRRAQLVIVMLAAAFFWLLSLTVSSLIWSAIPPLQDSTAGWAIIPIGVIVTETLRGLFIRFYIRSERSFSVVSINAIVFPLVDVWSSIAAGLGFGATQSFMYYAPILAHAQGPGALFSPHCTAFSSFFLAAWNSLLFNILHVGLMVCAFDAWRRVSLFRISIVVLLHAAAAGFTVLNNIDGGCVMSLPLIAGIVALTAAWSVYVTHDPEYRSSKGRRVHSA